MTDRPYTLDRVVRSLVTLAIMATLIWVVQYVHDVLIPLVAGILLAYLVDPTVKWVESWLKNHTAAVLLTVTAMLVMVSVVFAVLVPVVAHEFRSGVGLVRQMAQPDSPFRKRLDKRLPAEVVNEIQATLKDESFQELLRDNAEVQQAAVTAIKKIAPRLLGIVSGAMSLLGVIGQLFLVLVYLVFILMDFRKFRSNWGDFIPLAYRENIVGFVHDFNDAFSRYFRGQFIVASIVGILFVIGFSIIGLRMAIVLGLMLGAMNMVPYLQIVGFVPAIALAGMTAIEKEGSFVSYSLGVLAVFVVVQALQDVVITPRVMGKVTGLRPVIILFCVFFWGKLLGFLGVLLAIPLTCLGLAYYRRMLAQHAVDFKEHSSPAPAAS